MRRRWRLLLFLLTLSSSLTLAGAGWHHVTRPDYRLERGREALRRGDSDRAQYLALALYADGARDHAYVLRAEILFQQAKPYLDAEQPEAAAPFLHRTLEICNKVRDQGQLRVDAAAVSGLCLYHLKQPLQAEHALDFVVQQRPDHIDAHRGLAALYYDQGALMRSVHHLEEVARLDPQDGRPFRGMGHIYKELDQYPQAITAFEEALRRRLSEPVAEIAKENLAECLVKQSQFDRALEVLDSSDPQGEQIPKLVALRAECLATKGNRLEAQTLLDSSLAAYPRSPELLRLRARLHHEANERPAEAALLERAIAVDRHDYAARYQLAQAYQSLGRPVDAAEQRRLMDQTKDYLMEMTKLSEEAVNKPWDAPLRRRLADLCMKLDRPDQAAIWLRAAAASSLDEDPHGRPADLP